jgi:hypothetical protein
MIPKFRDKSSVFRTKSRFIECVCGGGGEGWKAISIGQFFRNGSSAGQQTPELSRNPKVHNRVHDNPQLGYTLSQMNPVHILAQVSLKFVLILTYRLILRHKSFFPFRLSE